KFYRIGSKEEYGVNDHTYESQQGHYIVVDFSFAENEADVANMYGPIVQEDSECLIFWYKFDIDLEDVSVFRVITNSTVDMLWSVEVGTGPDWQIAVAKMKPGNNGQRLQFEVFAPPKKSGYLAIDDIQLNNELDCPNHADCDFEHGICGWHQNGDLEYVLDKQHYEEPAPASPTYVMFVTPKSEGMEGLNAILSSPILIDQEMNCVRFWFMAPHEAPVYTVASVTQGPSETEIFTYDLWGLPANEREEWTIGQFPLPELSVIQKQ
ncbi:unnamed protein product, partial [Meganyctiphanes norvegica]